jgi:hypothetical protein
MAKPIGRGVYPSPPNVDAPTSYIVYIHYMQTLYIPPTRETGELRMQPSNLKILQGLLFLLFSANSILYLIQNDYSNWSIFMLLSFMILSAEPE